MQWSGLARSSYYYRTATGKRGRTPSTHTWMQDGSLVSNQSVVIAMRFVLAEEFMGCGYIKMTDDLRGSGFLINYKKTYRLMKEQRLLCGRMVQPGSGGSRQFVRWRVQQATRPIEQLCMDIKYVHIHGQQRNALLLTVLDVYTRSVVGQILWWHMRKEQVIWLLHRIVQQHQQPTRSITVRNDNGSQFIAHALRGYLKDKGVAQEFIHVATPEENCYIEAYHSIIQRELLAPRQFEGIGEAIDVFSRWKLFYNERRLHGSLGNKTPAKIWEEYLQLEQQAIREQEMRADTEALCTNGERKSSQFEESRLCIKSSEN